jgi:hypothetical protein
MLLVSIFFFMIPAICFSGGTGDVNIDVEIAATPLQEWMPNITYNPTDNEFMVIWHTSVVPNKGAQKMYSLHGQRVSPEGKLLGEAISIVSAGPESKVSPKPAHNTFANQYVVVFTMEQKETGQDPFAITLGSQGNILSGPACLSAKPTAASHTRIVFNSKRRQYLVTYNDSKNGNEDIFGIILGEDGTVIKRDFEVSFAEGSQINPYMCYNPTDDTYLVNWEDFRHVKHWKEPSNIYGALLDGKGNIIVGDIPMIEDHGLDDEGDQRHNTIAYNRHKNEFLVCWMDGRPSLNNLGIVGRIIKSDGSPSGPT